MARRPGRHRCSRRRRLGLVRAPYDVPAAEDEMRAAACASANRGSKARRVGRAGERPPRGRASGQRQLDGVAASARALQHGQPVGLRLTDEVEPPRSNHIRRLRDSARDVVRRFAEDSAEPFAQPAHHAAPVRNGMLRKGRRSPMPTSRCMDGDGAPSVVW